jgi:integrase
MDSLIPRNATEAVKPPQPSREEMHPLTPEQAKLLLQTAHEAGDRLEALYVLAIHTGLRQGELLGLKWDDVDLSGRDGASLPHPPLRTVLATFTAHGSSRLLLKRDTLSQEANGFSVPRLRLLKAFRACI